MNFLQPIIQSPVTIKLGWCLLHSIWQIGLIAIFTVATVSLLPTRRSSMRYWTAVFGLMMAVAIPASTYCVLPDPAATVAESESLPNYVNDSDAELANTAPAIVPPTVMYDPSAIAEPNQPPAAVAPVKPQQNVNARDVTSEPNKAISFVAQLETVAPWITFLWLIGVLLFAIRPMVGVGCSLRVRHRGRSDVPENVQAMASAIAKRLRLPHAIQIAQSTLVHVPTVVGFFKPMILVPASSLTGLTAKELEAIIAHEMAHIKRLDHIANLLQTMIETVLFFHPAMWWMSSIVRRERENCCDDMAVHACGDSKSLVRALLSLEEKRMAEPSLAANGGPLLKRVRRLAGVANSPSQSVWQFAVVGVLVIALMFVVIASTNAGSTGSSSDKEEFASLQITCLTDLYGFGSRTTFDDDLIEKFWNMFPEDQQSGQGETIDGWEPDLRLTFTRSSDNNSQGENVVVDLGLQTGFRWSVGNGIWLMDGQWPFRYGIAEFISATAESANEIRTDNIDELVSSLQQDTSSIVYSGTDMNDEVLKQIGESCPALLNLDLQECRRITDAGVADLSKLKSLRSLRLRFAERLTEKSAAIIAGLTELNTLDVSYARGLTTDLAMVDIVKLPKLQNLIVVRHSADGITATGHKMLKDHASLKRVLVNHEGQHSFVELLSRNLTNPLGPEHVTPYADPLNERFVVVADHPGNDYWRWVREATAYEARFSRVQRDVMRQRAANQRAYEENKEKLHNEHAGKWMAIVSGRLIGPFDEMDDAAEEADKIDPGAVHRYIFRPTVDDNDEEFVYSPWLTGNPNWWQFGRQFRSDNPIGIGPATWWSGDKQISSPDGKANITLTAVDNANKSVTRQAVCSAMVEQQLTITEMDVIELKLDRYSVPGTASNQPYKVACSKVMVEVAIPGLDISQRVMAFVMPHEVVSKDPPRIKAGIGNPLIIWPQIGNAPIDPDYAQETKPVVDESDNTKRIIIALDELIKTKEEEVANLKTRRDWINTVLEGGMNHAQVVDKLEEDGVIRGDRSASIDSKEISRTKTIILDLTVQREELLAKGLGNDHPDVKKLSQGILDFTEKLKQAAADGPKPLTDEEIIRRILNKINSDLELIQYEVDLLRREHTKASNKLNPTNDSSDNKSSADPERELGGNTSATDETSNRQEDESEPDETWKVIGKIVDEKGDPLEGVTIRANTGRGSLRRTGETTTDENGNYILEFGPGVIFNPQDDSADHVGVQAATIFASMDGYVEKDMCKAGDRLMAIRMPDEDTAWGSLDDIKDRLILRGEPATINFVMVRSATVSGYIISSDEKLIQKRSISITGDDLPPSSSVLSQKSSSISGHFKFDNVPLNKAWKLEFTIPKTFQDIHSEEFILDSTGDHKYLITVDIDSDPPSMKMEKYGDEQKAVIDRLTRKLITEETVIEGEKPEEDEALVWGKERDGLQAAVRLNNGNEYKVGETIDFEFVIRNVGEETMKFQSSSWRQEDNLKLQKVGERFVDVNKAWYSGWPIVVQYVLEPGEQVTLDSARIGIEGEDSIDPNEMAAYLVKLQPGSYQFYFRMYFPDINRFDPDPGENWKGGLYTGDVEFEVKE